MCGVSLDVRREVVIAAIRRLRVEAGDSTAGRGGLDKPTHGSGTPSRIQWDALLV